MTAASQAAQASRFPPTHQTPRADTPPRAAATKFDVFISYSHVDKAIGRRHLRHT